MATIEVIHAYRHLYRAGLRAVQYSYPASTGVRNMLRQAFRAKDAQQLNGRAIKRTIWFLKNAAREAGIEHKVVKSILRVNFEREVVRRYQQPTWTQIVQGTEKKHRPCVPLLLDLDISPIFL